MSRNSAGARLSARWASVAAASVLALVSSPARAGDALVIGEAKLDPPTLVSLGVQVLISGDDNHNAKITMRYRKAGTADFRDALPLLRVHPEVVTGRSVPAQFAGSVLELVADTTYDLELHAVDPDGSIDKTIPLTGKTRPVPRDPASPHAVPVTDAASLRTALGAAKAGDVITLAKGTYAGTFSIGASGTESAPIVIRGESTDGVVLDGGGCTGCNELEVYGSFVHVEQMTIQNVERSVRFQTAGAEGNVLRRLHVRDVTLGIGGKSDQKNFYVCDNVFEGRLKWPLTYGDDGAAHANDDGLVVSGTGMVVCHNTISGFADALQNFQAGTRGNDFYGNDVLWTYDDGIELDGTEGNNRCFRNRFSNTYDTLSYQPIYGGPVYTFRNVIVNVDNEGMKLHSEGVNPPSGVLVFNNTFVRPYHGIQLSTAAVVRYYALQNNLFVAPSSPTDGISINWDTPIDYTSGLIDWNGYYPDGKFHMGYGATGTDYASFAAMVAGGRYEAHGVLLDGSTFASGLAASSDHKTLVTAPDARLASASKAVDKGTSIPNITDGYRGAAPDLGAIELGCAPPTYGPRAVGADEAMDPTGCAPATPGDAGPGDAGGGDGGPSDGAPIVDAPSADAPAGDAVAGDDAGSPAGDAPADSSGGCGCHAASGDEPTTARSLFALLAGLAGLTLVRRRRR